MKKFFRIVLIVVILSVFIGTIGFLYAKSKTKPVVYETEQAEVTDIINKTVATGSVVPRKEVEIKPQVSGIVEEIFVQEGEVVKTGQVLARVRIVPNMINLNNAESRLNRAKISLEQSRVDFERQQMLLQREVIAQSEFLPYEVAYKNAREEADAAETNLQLVRDGTSQQKGSSSNTLIRSTIDGMVLEIPVEIGNSVIESNNFNPGTTIVSIADMNEMIFKGKVDESEVGKIEEGMSLILSIGAIEGVTFDAILEHISPKGQTENGAIQFEIRAAVSLDAANFIRSGYSATADIVLERRDQVLAINESLLIFENDSVFVEVEVAPQTFEKRLIKTGLSDGIRVEVQEGVDVDTRIKKLS
jgi:HlyD family secretion protein